MWGGRYVLSPWEINDVGKEKKGKRNPNDNSLVSIRHKRIYNDRSEKEYKGTKTALRFLGNVPGVNALEKLVHVRSLSLHEVFLKSIHYFCWHGSS